MKLKIGTKLYAGFGTALIIMAVLSVVAFNNISSLTRTAAQVQHTHEVLEDLNKYLVTLRTLRPASAGM